MKISSCKKNSKQKSQKIALSLGIQTMLSRCHGAIAQMERWRLFSSVKSYDLRGLDLGASLLVAARLLHPLRMESAILKLFGIYIWCASALRKIAHQTHCYFQTVMPFRVNPRHWTTQGTTRHQVRLYSPHGWPWLWKTKKRCSMPQYDEKRCRTSSGGFFEKAKKTGSLETQGIYIYIMYIYIYILCIYIYVCIYIYIGIYIHYK